MRTIFLYFIVVVLFTNCTNSKKEKTTDNSNKSTNWELVWSDEFNTDGLPDTSKWNYATRGNTYGWGNNEKQWYTVADTDNCYISDGLLTITAIKEATSGKEYSSARLTTKGKGDWKYCKVEVKAKLPTGKGTWPAIWMMPSDNLYGGWPKSGEIDIMEHVGYDPDTVHSTVHTERFNHVIGTQVGKPNYLPTATTEFHTYSMEWDENEIRSFVDGTEYFRFANNEEGYKAWPFDQSFHLILNLAVGGGWGGQQGIDDSLFPHSYEIDYVRIYQKK
jgi:beta-glucanase (GH16 family)